MPSSDDEGGRAYGVNQIIDDCRRRLDGLRIGDNTTRDISFAYGLFKRIREMLDDWMYGIETQNDRRAIMADTSSPAVTDDY